MGHLWIAPTVHIQQFPHKSPPGWSGYLRCCALCAVSRVSPAFAPQQLPALLMLADNHTRDSCSLSDASDCTAREVPAQDTLTRTPLWLTMMKAFLSGNGHQDPKKADGNASGKLAPCPQVSICPPPSKATIQWSLYSSTGAK
ncbi:hypothetical protein O181_065019 [Austropuccinia psidii MF-1]|uniref:Uncharacterized protein n=1 Tax=Austropuccinia psidii MF-1 TaxID=1389203 RepID=A0A9Q3EQN8_9BASI|nr:hypothetical protein [Austropuccinia psidii MF-1]